MANTYLQEVAVSLLDVNGNAITSMSNATVLEGYSSAVSVFGAMGVIFQIKDGAGGAAVAPSALVAGVKNVGDTSWSEDANFGGHKIQSGIAANFWRNPVARFSIYPTSAGSTLPAGARFPHDHLRVHFTIGATANLFTPTLRAWLITDGAGVYPLPS